MLFRPFLFLVVLSVATLAGCISEARLLENAYAGKTEAAVRSELGEPAHEFTGHYGNPDSAFTQRFSGEIKTLVFKRGRTEHYVSFEKRPTGWIGICSSSVPEGTAF